MIQKYKEEQFLITTLLSNAIENDKIVQAYMFNCNDINYIMEYAKEFAKDLISKDLNSELSENISKKIDKNIYDELKIIEPINNMIKKEQFLSLKDEIKTKPIEGNKIVYIIKNCEKLNLVTANAMLKFIEDANDDVIAIFLTDNLDLVIPTIKSRCEILNFKNNDKTDNFYEFICKINSISDIELVTKLVDNSVLFIKELEKINKNIYYKLKQLVYDIYTDSTSINIFVSSLLYFYYDMLNYKVLKKIKYIKEYNELIIQLSDDNSLDKIINKISIIEQIKKDNSYNLNQKLLIDRLTLELCEV